jgi:hypothetical protein
MSAASNHFLHVPWFTEGDFSNSIVYLVSNCKTATNIELEKSGRGVFWDNLSRMSQESQERTVRKADSGNSNRIQDLANITQC